MCTSHGHWEEQELQDWFCEKDSPLAKTRRLLLEQQSKRYGVLLQEQIAEQHFCERCIYGM
jgi:hypothetical protein